jgi:hypothetical protein
MRINASQPCVACGDDTTAGRPRFVGRRTISGEAGSSYLCATCDEAVATRRGRPLTEDEVRRLVESGAMGAYVWSGYAHLGGVNFFGD